MDSLPPELTRLLIAPLTRISDIGAFSAISRTHYEISQEALHAHLPLEHPKFVVQLAETLAEDDPSVPGRKRGDHVRSISVEMLWFLTDGSFAALGRLFKLVPNLEEIYIGLTPAGELLLPMLRRECRKLRKFELALVGERPQDTESALHVMAEFTNLEDFTFKVEAASLWIIYEIPSQIVTMLSNSHNLHSLSIISLQGRGWSLDVALLLLLPSYRPSLRSLTLQGVACNLSIENFEVDNRTLVQFLLSLSELEQLSLGGSIGRRNLELRMMMKDSLEEGEREVLFPKLRDFEGTSTNFIWLISGGNSPITKLRINELEPIDEGEFASLLVALPPTMKFLSIAFARWDPLRPTVGAAIERIATSCPNLQSLEIATVSSLRFSERSMTRTSVASSYADIIHAILAFPLLTSLRLPPASVCGITGDLSLVAAEFFDACSNLLRLDFAGEERDGRSVAVASSRWERRCSREGTMYAVEVM